jgi:hypothetical protein
MTVMQGFVPQSGDGGVGVALISYCDQVMLSVQSDVGQLAATTPAAGAGEKAPVVPLEEAFFAEVQHLKALAQAKAAAASIAAADGPLTTQETKKAK